MTSNTTSATAPALRQVLTGALVGTFVEWFDFALFAYTVPVFAVVFFGTNNISVSLLYTFGVVYGVPFIFRPIGGVLWGHLGDRVGRRTTLAIIVSLMGVASALVAAVPTKAVIGIAAPLLIIILRSVQAFCASGEAIGAAAFLMEHTDPKRRGLLLGILNSFTVIPSACAALLVVGLTTTIGTDAFASWGWRMLFVLGGACAAIGLYIRRRLPETEAFERVAEAGVKRKSPALTALREYPRGMIGVFGMIGITGLAYYMLTGFLSAYLSEGLHLSRTVALLSNGAAVLVVGVLGVVFGALSDRIGRRRPMILTGVAILAVVGIPAFQLASNFGWQGALGGQLLIALGIAVTWSGGVPFMQESFPTRVRYSGAAVSYNMAYAILGGTAPLISQYLVNSTKVATAPGYYLSIIAILAFVLLVMTARETAGADLLQAGDWPGTSSRSPQAAP